VIAMLALAFATLPPAVQPWPIGPGPRYRPVAIHDSRPVGRNRCGRDSTRFAVHLELFANRRAIIIPAGIGVAPPLRRTGADVKPGGCVFPLHTTAPTGVVRVGTRNATVGDLFRIWRQPLGRHRLLSFGVTGSNVRVFVGGRERTGDPRSVRLTRNAQIVVEIGGYVTPHPSYLFPKGGP
jgi:hypothetical protein